MKPSHKNLNRIGIMYNLKQNKSFSRLKMLFIYLLFIITLFKVGVQT